jgi:hypothetical protein
MIMTQSAKLAAKIINCGLADVPRALTAAILPDDPLLLP